MKTVKDVFTVYKQGLSAIYDANETEALTLLAVSEITSLSKAKIKAFPETGLTSAQIQSLGDILSQLKTSKPIQYILGKTEFYGLPLYVNPSVLIPRPETEELVAWAISELKAESRKQKAENSILDIGTGSGCIAISLKKNLPGFDASAIDISAAALQTARENAKLNDVEVEFIEADILNHKSEIKNKSEIENSKFEIIISNPPYVTLHDKTQMQFNVTNFEPHTALFVPKNDPLIFYKAIAGFALTHLSENGLLFFEINESLGEETVELLRNKGFKDVELRKDMSGKDRMIKANI